MGSDFYQHNYYINNIVYTYIAGSNLNGSFRPKHEKINQYIKLNDTVLGSGLLLQVFTIIYALFIQHPLCFVHAHAPAGPIAIKDQSSTLSIILI